MNEQPTPPVPPSAGNPALLVTVTLGGLVGVLAGGVAIAFRLILEWIDAERDALFGMLAPMPVIGWLGPMLIIAIALFAAAELVRRYAPEAAGSGIQEIEGTLGGTRRLNWRRILPVKFLAGLLALGSGAVLGREGPTVHMGGAIGAMMSDRFRCGGDGRNTLIAAGAGAGLSAAFNAPLAGILFVMEEMRRYVPYRFASFEALAVAAVTADIVTRLAVGQNPVIQIPSFPSPPVAALWLFLILGAVFGVIGVAFNRILLATLNGLDRLPDAVRRLFPLAIGSGLGALAFLVPTAIGGGYSTIGHAIEGQIAGSFLLTLFAIRFAATILSYAAGAPGGIFMPMMALGTLFGIAFGLGAQDLFPAFVPYAGVFAVAGMAAFFSASVRAPLTGIALALEMTGDFQQLLPLIITAIAAHLAAQLCGGRAVYELLLERTIRTEHRS